MNVYLDLLLLCAARWWNGLRARQPAPTGPVRRPPAGQEPDLAQDHPHVGEVRGLGMIAGIEVVSDRDSRGTFAPEFKLPLIEDLLSLPFGLMQERPSIDMDEEVVTELIQNDCNTKRIKEELQKLLTPDYRKTLLKKYDVLEEKLGGVGASKKTAKLIVEDLKEQ